MPPSPLACDPGSCSRRPSGHRRRRARRAAPPQAKAKTQGRDPRATGPDSTWGGRSPT